MCGIAGIAGARDTTARRLVPAVHALSRRGPDGKGFAELATDGTIRRAEDADAFPRGPNLAAFAHTRLAILDPTAASDQPMLSADGTVGILFNGEIYNFLELRRDLEASGHSFRTTGDTEVLLTAYLQWGRSFVDHLIGMWALAVVDGRRRELVLARDRFGIKPLYWMEHDSGIAFASEIKALLALGSGRARADETVVSRYLMRGALDDSDCTFFDGIRSLPAASMATVSLESGHPQVEPVRWWDLAVERSTDATDATERFRAAFEDAVRLHLRSDVALGTCLSGGLDSSSIVSVAAGMTAAARASAPYVAIGFCPDDPKVSERPYMEAVAAETGVELSPVSPTYHEVSRAIPEVIAYHDEPVGSASVIAQWFVFARARELGLKVMLDGQGADEYLGGYQPYLRVLALSLLRSGRIGAYRRFVGAVRGAGQPFQLAPGEVAEFLLPGAIRRRLRATRLVRRRDAARAVMHPSLAALADPVDTTRPEPRDLAGFLARDVLQTSLPRLLRFEDRNSMAHSIEARVPFLDHRLVELAFSLPDDEKIDGAETKVVLRRAMRGIVPQVVLDRRDKVGFRASPDWTSRYAVERAGELVDNATDAERAWFRSDAIAALLAGPSDDVAREFLLWRVINLKLWARSFLD
jgi:asparagine synthase (glutamine-hydrolysing)